MAIGNDADYINSQVENGNRAIVNALEHYRNAGERLSKVRENIKARGQRNGISFKTWIENNCRFKKVTAYKYIELYENWNESFIRVNDSAPKDLKAVLKQIAESKATEKEIDDEVLETIDIKVIEVIETQVKDLVEKERNILAEEKKISEKEQKILAEQKMIAEKEENILAEQRRIEEKEKNVRAIAEQKERELIIQ